MKHEIPHNKSAHSQPGEKITATTIPLLILSRGREATGDATGDSVSSPLSREWVLKRTRWDTINSPCNANSLTSCEPYLHRSLQWTPWSIHKSWAKLSWAELIWTVRPQGQSEMQLSSDSLSLTRTKLCEGIPTPSKSKHSNEVILWHCTALNSKAWKQTKRQQRASPLSSSRPPARPSRVLHSQQKRTQKNKK